MNLEIAKILISSDKLLEKYVLVSLTLLFWDRLAHLRIANVFCSFSFCRPFFHFYPFLPELHLNLESNSVESPVFQVFTMTNFFSNVLFNWIFWISYWSSLYPLPPLYSLLIPNQISCILLYRLKPIESNHKEKSHVTWNYISIRWNLGFLREVFGVFH